MSAMKTAVLRPFVMAGAEVAAAGGTLDLKCTSTSRLSHMNLVSQPPRDPTTATVANAGVVRPPLVVLASLLSGAMLTVAWPLPFFPREFCRPVGGVLVAMAAALFS